MCVRPVSRVGAALAAALLMASTTATDAVPQTDGPRRARLTLGLELGAQLPATLYDERVTARLDADQFRISTAYRERLGFAPLVRSTLRYRPESGFGLYLAGQWATATTTARYSGGEEPIESFDRSVSFWAMEAGVTVRLGSWGNRGGGIGYALGPAMVRHSLDLSSGHRDSFAWVKDFGPADQFTWADRNWSSWALGLSASARLPVSDRWALRISLQDHVISVGTSQLESQDRRDVRRMTGSAPVFLYSNYTAHYLAFRAGGEYVLAWEPAPGEAPRIALPTRTAGEQRPTPEVVHRARRLIAEGDTAPAMSALREHIEEEPEDAVAWRELALILAAVAENRPDLRDEAWNVLQRALNLSPGESSLLTAYGRMQALMRRAGAQPSRGEPLAISGVSARADAAGGLSVAFAVRNLTPASPGAMARYRIEVEVVDSEGESVPLREAGSEEEPARQVTLTREAEAGEAVSDLLELRLLRATPGPYSVRVWVTDLGSGQTVEGSGGFQIR